MSAKACSRCGSVIVFGKDRDSGRIIPLSVGMRVYRVIRDDEVELDPKALVPHVCHGPPVTDRDFTQSQQAQ